MNNRAACWLIAVLFGISAGHFAWLLFGPPFAPEYMVGGHVTMLAGPNPQQKRLYLRRTVHLSARARHAWLQVLSRDRINVYVNGIRVGKKVFDGFTVGIVTDLTPYLRVGRNVIAIESEQARPDTPPVVAIDGGYTQQEQEYPLVSDQSWRVSAVFERGATWWFSPDFDDRHWSAPSLIPGYLRGKVEIPPRAITTARSGQWMTPVITSESVCVARREFTVAGKPHQAWLRFQSIGACRLALNGIVIHPQEDLVGSAQPTLPILWTYDVTRAMKSGTNVFAAALIRSRETPHLLADLEVEDESGQRYQVSTDGEWLGHAGLPPDWLKKEVDDQSAWRPCLVAPGDVGAPPWNVAREFRKVQLPQLTLVQSGGFELILIAMISLTAFLVCRAVAGLLSGPTFVGARSTPAYVVYLALVPATLFLSASILAVWDPRIARQDVFHPAWLFWALISVPVQWALLALAGFFRSGPRSLGQRSEWFQHSIWTALLVVLLAAGGWLRMHRIADKPLHPDEVSIYQATRGLLDRGFPSITVHHDLPPFNVNTSELLYYGTALSALVFDQEQFVVRFPAVCWGTLTIGLIYLVGRRMFGRRVGFIAAAVYAFSPICIEMSNFGRYPSQLQFMALLTIYFFWRTLRGTGPIGTAWLWCTAVSFVGMFLSWEGSALIAPGMILSALAVRRGRIRSILCNAHVWGAMLLVLLVVVLQYSLRVLELTQRLWYGTGASDVTLMPMWRYPDFELCYYLWSSSWNQDAVFPMVGLLLAGAITLRHAQRQQIRFLMLILLTTCFIMALLLSLKATRYGYFQTPLLILLCSAALGAGARGLVRFVRGTTTPMGWRAYAHCVSLTLVGSAIAFGSGMTIQESERKEFQVAASVPEKLWFPDLAGPVGYLHDQIQPGDTVLSCHPHVVDQFMTGFDQDSYPSNRFTDYYVQSNLQFQVVLDDYRPLPLHRLRGTPTALSLQSLEDLFARRDRIWYVTVPRLDEKLNNKEVSAFLRQHMDAVYEDFESLVLFRGADHRSAQQWRDDKKELSTAKFDLLP